MKSLATMESDPQLKEYHGSCHCGLLQLRLHIPKLTTVWTCSCHMCARNGYLWIFPVPEKGLVIETGTEKQLHAYEFAMRGTTHLFCPECGSSVMARRREAPPNQSLRINVRMLEGADLTTLEVKSFSGADVGQNHQAPQPPSSQVITTDEEELKIYHGNCHCGAFKFSAKIPELKSARTCNCSLCLRKGSMWHWPVPEENLVVEKGGGTLRSYEFGSKNTTHLFCPTCGSSILAKKANLPPGRQIAINIRMFNGIDFDSLEDSKFDGASLGSKYIPPPVPEHGGEIEEGMRVYNGNCHCGSVTYTVKSKPLGELKVMSCNCSLCSRNGDLWIYPASTNVQVRGAENLTEYTFLSKQSPHCFCSKCGVSMLVRVQGGEKMPINLRTMNGIDLSTLNLQHYDGKAKDPQYAV